jgi:non-ribosomal peptide synthetase-like protein
MVLVGRLCPTIAHCLPWTQSVVTTTEPLLLHQIFATVAGHHADRVAVEVPPGRSRPQRLQVTYAELGRQADAVASALRSLVRRDVIAAILLPRDTPALYAAQLGVLQAGAAFLCLDPAFPDEHLGSVLEDAGAAVLVTDAHGRQRLASAGISGPPILPVDELPPACDAHALVPADPQDLAYVIYTSGTTGRPKGVLIEHRGIVNLVTSDVDYFGLTCDDRIAQCSSPAYDSSIEETWLAFAVGATLVLLDDETVRLGPDLAPWLQRERVTVLCPPPTLLRTMACADPQRELPDLRLVYVGGEALSADLADRWSAGRWLENGYGPTECTVTVVRGRVHPGRPVTIGRPVRGHQAWVLDGELQPVVDGQAGELCIAGVGLARGYHRRDEQTAQQFFAHPQLGRIYRTGDRVRRNDNGDLEYLGRMDGQVKLRGYRIELEAIEAHLAACPGVRAAACRVQGEGAGQVLVAHIVPQTPADPPAIEHLKESLRRSLPGYMVPSRFAFLDSLPTGIGGKLNRNALPDVESSGVQRRRPFATPRSEQERTIADSFASALRISDEISADDDFFLDLGGDSLAAVGVICQLRSRGGAAAAVRDLYEAPTVALLAKRLCSQPAKADAGLRFAAARAQGRPVLSTAIQSLWLAVGLVASSAILYWLVFELLPFLLGNLGAVVLTMAAPLLGILGLAIYTPCSIALAVIVKRLLIGRYEPIHTPVWSGLFTRHWIVVSAAQGIPWWFLEGTALQAAVLRALGARVGRRVQIHRGVDLTRGGWDLLAIGDDVTLAQDAAVRVAEFDDGQLVLGPIHIGDGATVDVRAGLSPHSAIGRNGYLTALSWLPKGGRIPEGEQWDGVPAQRVGSSPPQPTLSRDSELGPVLFSALMLLARCMRLMLAWMPLGAMALGASLSVPDADARLLQWLNQPAFPAAVLAVVLAVVAAALGLGLVLQAVALRAMGRVRPGVWSQWSLEAIRIWVKTGVVDSASRWLSGAVFWPWWLRLAGMRIGRRCEISTIIDVVPETVTLGDESFFADGVYFCGPWRHRGTITVAESSLGRNTFLGNHSLVPIGKHWPDGLFLGVSTVADPNRAKRDSAWFGHPPMQLPRRQVLTADRRLTHEPGPVRYGTRVFWELLRFTLPALPILVACVWYWLMAAAAERIGGCALVLGIAPILSLGAGLALCLAVVALKWVLLGRVRPGQHPFWSCWCGRWDFLYVAWSYWARRTLAPLEGTLLLNGFLRLTGMRIGRRVVLDFGMSQVVDPDMLTFEDEATVACHFQAHSFEDRILKIGRIRIGRQATAGDNAVVFYGADIGAGAQVKPHSVVMKQDVLEPHGRYVGCPTRPVAQAPEA